MILSVRPPTYMKRYTLHLDSTFLVTMTLPLDKRPRQRATVILRSTLASNLRGRFSCQITYMVTVTHPVEPCCFSNLEMALTLNNSNLWLHQEINAAKKAGLQAVVVDRPGNDPLSDKDRTSNIVVKSFSDIPKPV